MMERAVLNIGHRGASGSSPENTLASFRGAIDAGAQMCELDVRLTRDGVPIVIHDETVDRTTDGCGAVADFTLEEIKRLDAGGWFDRRFAGERIPTLDEVFTAVKGRCALNIELKAGNTERQVCELIRKYGTMESSIVSSFEWDLLWRVREIEPAVRIGLLAEADPARLIAQATANSVAAIHPRFDLASAELCRAAHSSRLRVYTWTVDAPEAMRVLVGNGVDGIITNYPERLLPMSRS
jgi:glycerophosphoryl diester phosphodiesterase